MIIDDNAIIDIKVCSRSHNYLIAIDGRNESCDEDMAITVRKADYRQLIIRAKNHSFIQNLQEKLMWGRDIRE
jgi:NAD+ kinase